jgi:RNA polymerase sigma-70 factor (ECF subfamily)
VFLHEPNKIDDSQAQDERLRRAQAGDRQAFASLVRAHQRAVYGLALRMLTRADLAEELAQDVFLKLFYALRELASADHLRFWLRRVTANLAIDRLRQPATARTHVGLETVEVAAPDVEGDPLSQRTLRHLIANLEPAARAVLLLRYQEDLDPMDIAEVLEMPVNTVKSHLKRSLAGFRENLEGVSRD